jgi:hypothetical protein
MVSMMEDKLEDFEENLGYEDEDSEGVVPFEMILRTMRLSGVPKPVDEELEFLEYCAMKESHSLQLVRWEKLCELFDEDYLFSNSIHEDKN